MKLIAYDLGTGGVKASLYDEALQSIAKSFIEYATFYPSAGRHEQRPSDWWNGILQSTKNLLQESQVRPEEITGLSISGQSCAAIGLDQNLEPVSDKVPIWSDTRAIPETEQFFRKIDSDRWYLETGNGFPAPCYAIFKLMWMKNHEPELFAKVQKVAGSKDYINLKLTGNLMTDYSYASSSGAYSLKDKKMVPAFLDAAGLSPDLFPPIVPSHHIVGTLTEDAATLLGLHAGVKVSCGAVDNACMALGAVGAQDGAVYVSLGSSSWIPVNSKEPVLDPKTRPYVFAHAEENMFTSAYSIFAGGSSYQWCRDELCRDLVGKDAYRKMDELAAQVPVGAGGILFNPSLAGGTSQDRSIHIRGAFVGLHLGTTREAMIRAVLEGISMNLRTSLNLLAAKTPISDRILFCGGGSKSALWMQIFADVFHLDILKTNIDQDTASLGAAAICARSLGLFKDYDFIQGLHQTEALYHPDPSAAAQYDKLYRIFLPMSDMIADLGEMMNAER